MLLNTKIVFGMIAATVGLHRVVAWDFEETFIKLGLAFSDLLVDPKFQDQVVNAVDATEKLKEPLNAIDASFQKTLMLWNSKIGNTPGYTWAARHGPGTQIMKVTVDYENQEKGSTRWTKESFENPWYFTVTPSFKVTSFAGFPRGIFKENVTLIRDKDSKMAARQFIHATGYNKAVAKALSPNCQGTEDIISMHESDHLEGPYGSEHWSSLAHLVLHHFLNYEYMDFDVVWSSRFGGWRSRHEPMTSTYRAGRCAVRCRNMLLTAQITGDHQDSTGFRQALLVPRTGYNSWF